MPTGRRTIAICLALLSSVALRASAQTSPQTFVTYRCQQKSAADVATILRPLLPDASSVQLVVDRDRNQLLLSGSPEVQAIARRVLEEVDRRAVTARDESPRSVRVYRVARDQQDEFLARLEDRFPKNQIRSSADRQNGRVLVHASGDVHRAIDNGLLRPNAESAPRPLRRNLPQTPPAVPGEFEDFVPMRPNQISRRMDQLSAIFGERLIRRRGARTETLYVEIRESPPVRIEISDLKGLRITGPPEPARQLTNLIRALERDARVPGSRTKVLGVRRENHRSIRKLVDPEGPDKQGASSRSNRESVALAQFIAQNTPRRSANPDEGPQATEPKDASLESKLRQFEGVEVESLPDLDVIILTGRDEDLDQLAEIIRQIERISRETRPTVKVYHLQHARSESIAELTEQVSGDLVSGRAGKVSVNALSKPNAILLVGWGEAVEAMVDLIRRLDQPVAPETQSAIMRLKHASVTAAQETLTNFFTDRGSLGPQVQMTVDVRTNSLIVYAAPRDMREVRRIVSELDRPDSSAVNRAHIFRIENAMAADVAETLEQAIQAAAGGDNRSAILELQTFDAKGQRLLRSGTLEDVRITANARNNTIIVSGPTDNLPLIGELIRQLDSPGAQAQIKVFGVENGDAASLIETLRSILPSQPVSAVGPQLSSAPGDDSLAPLRFSVDVRSNSIIATGSEGDLRIVEALLIKLDQSTTLQRKSAVFQLKNSPANDVANAVNQFLVSRRQVEQAVPGSENPFQDIEREVVVVPEPVANKLILAATPRYFEEVQALIEKLDEQPPQVMIQVLIAEVALNDIDEFGVELGIQESVLFDRSLLGDLITTTNTQQGSTNQGIITSTQEIVQGATNLPGFSFNNKLPLGNSGSDASLATADVVGGQGISNFDVGRGNDLLGFGGLVLSASSQNVSVLIRALQQSRRVDILSRPQIRTLDNQPAFIQVGQRVPRIVGSTVNQNGQSNSVTLENVGLILGVTPRISPEGMVVMEIDAERSRVGPEDEGIPVAVSIDGTIIRSPRVDTATAQATVSAADGETIVLGGLITEEQQSIHRKVPYLGDVPILRNIFRYDSVDARRSELLIILTPRIIRTTEDSERIRQTEMARMSWCAADVFDLHGESGFTVGSSLHMIESGEPEIIYPHINPRGEAAVPPLPDAATNVIPTPLQYQDN